MKALPPFSPTMYGKRQMLPSPTAKPTEAIRKVRRDDQFSVVPCVGAAI